MGHEPRYGAIDASGAPSAVGRTSQPQAVAHAG
jgi:hypothetical protein